MTENDSSYIPGGYVLQPRKLDDSETMKAPPIVRELFQYIIRKVNHDDNGKYKRGSGFFCLSDIQDDLCWYVGYRKMKYSKPQLTKSLRRLCGSNTIATAKATRGLYITVLNYNKYQNPKNYESNDERQTKETRRKREGHTKNKNGKNERIKNITNTPYNPPKNIDPQKNQNDFEIFWRVFPKKIKKVPAQWAWLETAAHRPDIQTLVEIIEKQKQSDSWTRENGRYIPNPESYLMDCRWADELEPSTNGATPMSKTTRHNMEVAKRLLERAGHES